MKDTKAHASQNMTKILSSDSIDTSSQAFSPYNQDADLIDTNQANFRKLFQTHVKTTNKKVPF
jgi:hypothetical protein